MSRAVKKHKQKYFHYMIEKELKRERNRKVGPIAVILSGASEGTY